MADTATPTPTMPPRHSDAQAAKPPSKHATLPGSQATPVLTKFVFKLVKRKARQLVGKTGYTLDDVDDIQQELVLDLLEQLPQYDPDLASYKTFVVRVVDRKVCKMLRHRRMEKRDYRRETGSIYDQMYTGGDQAMQQIEVITEKEHDRRLGISSMSQVERSHLEIDVRTLLEYLPPDLRRVAELLQTMSPNQAAEHLNLSHTTFYRNYLVPLREILQSKDMDGYLS